MKRIAGIILKDRKGRVLAIHASKHPDTRWGVPKGRIDKGETPKQAAIREFREETGINLKKYKKKIKKVSTTYTKKKTFYLFELTIKKSIKGKIDGSEIDGMFWVKRKEFKSVGEKHQRKMI